MKEELEKILRSEFYVNDHDNCDDSCSKKWYSNQAFERAVTSIINLFEKEIIGEDTPRKLHYYDEVERENVYYADEAGSIRETENHLKAKQRAKLKGDK